MVPRTTTAPAARVIPALGNVAPTRILTVAALAAILVWCQAALAQAAPQPAGPTVTGLGVTPGPSTAAPTGAMTTTPAPGAPPVAALGSGLGPSTVGGPFAQIPRAETPIVVDGSTGEQAWSRALSLSSFIVLNGEHRALQRTETRVVYDAANLYIAFRCEDKDPSSAVPVVTERDDPRIYDEDNVEIYVDPVGDKRSYVHVVVNRGGAFLDEIGRQDPKAKDWSGLLVATGPDTWGWEVELAIPLAEVGLSGVEGSRFTMNVARNRIRLGADGKRTEENSSWNLCRGSLRDPSSFGEMVFSSRPAVLSIADLGDGFGELRGGANAKLRLDSALPRTVVAVVTLMGGGTTRSFQVAPPDSPPAPLKTPASSVTLDGQRPKKVEVPYAVPGAGYTLCQVQVLDATGQTVLFRTPQMPLHETWLGPRLAAQMDALDADEAFLTTLPASDTQRTALAGQVAGLRAKGKAIREMIDSRDVYGSAPRWMQIDQQLKELEGQTRPVALKLVMLKGRTPAEVQAGTLPGFVVSGRDWMRPALPTTVPDLADIKPRTYCFACPGETESTTLLVTASQPLLGCTALLSDFVENSPTTPATGSFPGTQAKVRVVQSWPQAGAGRQREPGAGVTTPELLVYDATRPITGPTPDVPLTGAVRFDVGGTDGSVSKQLWIDVTVPRGTPPGLYESTLTVTPQGGAPRSAQILVKVIGLELVEPRQKWMVFFHNTLGAGSPLSTTPELYRAYLSDIAAHGFSQATVSDPGGKLLEALQARKEAGLVAPVLVSMRGVPIESVGAFVATAKRLVDGKGLPEMLFYTLPDPRTRKELEDAIGLAEAIQASGGRTTTLISPSTAVEHGGSLDIPIYNAYDADFQTSMRAILKGEAQADPRTEYYHFVGTLEDPIYNRLLCGFYIEKTRLDGVFVSSYQDPVGCPDPYNELAGSGADRPQMLTYPTASGPLGTIQWEAAREGRDDMRYLATLQALIDQAAPYQMNPAVSTALKEARDVVAQLSRTLQVDWYYDVAGIGRDFYQKMRWEIATKALRLQDALRTVSAVPPPAVGPAPTLPGVTGAPSTTPPAPTGTGFLTPSGPNPVLPTR